MSAENRTPQMIVDDAITSRRSVRAFLPTPVPRETLEEILQVASRAPSGTNIQPWLVYALTGEAKTSLSNRIIAAFDNPEESATHSDEWQYYPKEWISPYIDRRRKIGFDLYKLLGIQKGEADKMHAQFARNYRFFDAPVGLIFTIDRVMEQGAWLDYGMFLENIMIAARARGLDTCVQAAFMQFHRIIADELQLPANERILCGMSLGYADPADPANQLQTERAPLTDWVRFRD